MVLITGPLDWESSALTTRKPDNSNKGHEQRKNNESSTKQVELSQLKEEIKNIKRTIDILLERQ